MSGVSQERLATGTKNVSYTKDFGPAASAGGLENLVKGIGGYPLKVFVSSYEGRAVDALGQRADEGRGKRRYAGGSCNRAMIPGFPNGVTRLSDPQALPAECIGGVEGSR